MQYNPWWRVDFSSEKKVERVVVWNRVDCCQDVMIGCEVELHDANDDVLASSPITSSDQFTGHDFGSVSGVKSVRVVQTKSDQRYFLWLAEVQVFGLNDEDLVAGDSGKVARQSSELGCALTCISSGWALPAAPGSKAIDGNFGQSWTLDEGIAHTWPQLFPWWRVDLGFTATVHRVKVWNRSDYQDNMPGTVLEFLGSSGQILHSQQLTTVENIYNIEIAGGVAGVTSLRLAKYDMEPKMIYFAEFEAFGYRA